MSQENVDLVRRAFEAHANGGIEELVQYATPDCVFYPDPGWMEELAGARAAERLS